MTRLGHQPQGSRLYSWAYDILLPSQTGCAKIGRVYLSSPINASLVQESLVHYDGYAPDIQVRRGPRFIQT